MAVGAIVAAVGTGLNFMGQMEAAEKEEEAARFNAENSRQQAYELLRRYDINKKQFVREVEQFKAQQVASYAKSGVDINSGSALVQLEQTNNAISDQLKFMEMEASSKAEALFRGADMTEWEARELKGARELSAFGGALGGLGGAASSYSTSSSNINAGTQAGVASARG